jgi:hypothetical protein
MILLWWLMGTIILFMLCFNTGRENITYYTCEGKGHMAAPNHNHRYKNPFLIYRGGGGLEFFVLNRVENVQLFCIK